MPSLRRLCRAPFALLLLTTTLFAPLSVLAQTKTKLAGGSKGVIANAAATTGKVALYATDESAYVSDVQSKLTGTGLFTQVDAFNLCSIAAPTPTLTQLQQYDAVMVWSDCGFPDATGLGNVLADYIDGGGGVVLAVFGFNGGISSPQGRLSSGGYFPLTMAGAITGRQTLVKDIPSHPILQGVNSFDGGLGSYRSATSLTAGAQQVARWTDNRPLVATKQITAGRMVGLNMFPPSSSVDSVHWITTTDGARLMANSLLFAGRQLAPGTSPTAGQIIISEFRTSGPAGSKDEFIELYNATDSDITVNVNNTGSDAGLTIVIAQPGDGCRGNIFLAVPNGTFIPARGHYLVTDSQYGLGASAPSDINPFAVFSYDMPDNTALDLRKTEGVFTQLDKVGFGTNTCGGFLSEGTTLTPIDTAVGASDQYSFVRKLTSGLPQDTNDNAADFMLVSPTAAVGSTQAARGAAGPENSASPLQRNATVKGALIDPYCAGFGTTTSACARVRTADGANPANAALGTLRIRRKFFNKTIANITRLRFRVVDITTTPESGVADLRVVGGTGSFNVTDTNSNPVTIQRLTLEQPPTQANGGGFNSTLAAGTIALGTPLIPNNSINVEFILGVMQSGNFRFLLNVEALP